MADSNLPASLPVSRSDTLTEDKQPYQEPAHVKSTALIVYSSSRKAILLALFCISQFIDVFNNSALFSAIPEISRDLGVTPAQSTWVISATQLTFAAFLLIVRIS